MRRVETIAVVLTFIMMLGAVAYAYHALRTAAELHNETTRIVEEVHNA